MFDQWEKTGVLQQLRSLKEVMASPCLCALPQNALLPKVHREKKGSSVDSILRAYAASIKAGGMCVRSRLPMVMFIFIPARGALLSCVVGGKMSEGINFKDELGRCGRLAPPDASFLSLPRCCHVAV